MSALERTVAASAVDLAAVRSAAAEVPPQEVAAAATLGFVSEPGDGVLGRLVAALGPVRTAERLLAEVPSGELAAEAAAHGAAVSAQEVAAGLQRWRPRLDHAAFARGLAQAARVGARLLLPDDEEWPDGMRDLDAHAPLTLWVRGRVAALRETPSIALVGARAATGYGEHVAIESAAGLVDRGFAVVSGGAYGIDGTAHRSALSGGGTTVAFLAGGVDRFYPVGHEALLARIAEAGAVVSEMPCGAAPTRWRFLQRNRLIAAAAQATVVLEAGMRSGSLNTAGHAAALGRPLGAVPGPVTSPASAGCHRLLREFDAVCVTDAAQMAELVGLRTADGGAVPGAVAGVDRALDVLGPDERRVLDALGVRRARTVAELARRSGLGTGAVLGALGALDATGLARLVEEGWVRRRSA
ncbi:MULTISPECIES: DNA-processing protein DprA [unclassified Agromyces]|uniref:DNA-processing protein DprA n=1 Tax=unclassified Agromyces TaxID=2639701 RepID=UPI00301426A5